MTKYKGIQCFWCSKEMFAGFTAKYIKGDMNTKYCSEDCLNKCHNDICVRDYQIDILDLDTI